MPEKEPPRAAGNVTRHGRYGGAREDEPHMEPEVAPRTREGETSEPPRVLPGALPENEGEDPDRDQA